MKKFMVITSIDGSQHAKFFDKLVDAEEYRMNAECGCGLRAQVYELETDKYTSSYRFIYE